MTKTMYQPLLVVEDSNEDFKILQRLMKRMEVKNPIYRCIDGHEMFNFLYQQGDDPSLTPSLKPSVILLDLNLPGLDGRHLLEQVKQDITLQEIPIVVFTTSSNPKDIELCYQKGANGYIIKPMDSEELTQIVRAFVEFWLKANTPPKGT